MFLHRIDQSEIARQYIERTQVDVLLGGGAVHWFPTGFRLPGSILSVGSARGIGTQGNLVERADDLGYEFVSDAAGLRQSLAHRGRGSDGPLLGLFSAQEFFVQAAEGLGASVRSSRFACGSNQRPRLPFCLNGPKGSSSWSKSRPSIACVIAITRRNVEGSPRARPSRSSSTRLCQPDT